MHRRLLQVNFKDWALPARAVWRAHIKVFEVQIGPIILTVWDDQLDR